MRLKVKGIHHISGIVEHPQENIDFYTSVLGLKAVKKAVNFDNPETYHFYYSNDSADLGTIITFFPWADKAKKGLVGDGQVGVTSYMIPVGTIGYWEERLKSFKIIFEREYRFNQTFLAFEDKHGIKNELVESPLGSENEWEFNNITKDKAIKGFFGAVFYSKKTHETKDFLINILGLELVKEDELYYRFEMKNNVGKYIDLYKESQGEGRLSTGTNHHIAFSVGYDEIDDWKKFLELNGFKVSDVKNRNFFKSLYFREPGGIIIELATDKPGFKKAELDPKMEKLYLPEWFENRRTEIEEKLIPVFVEPTEELKDYPYQNKEEYELYIYHQTLLKRINELSRISKTRKLTDEEITEREELRNKYVINIRSGMTDLITTVKFEDKDGEVKDFFTMKEGDLQ
ncbi:VOC family protein [Haploplasma axanthum]|nr:VOC family protein [Haploplasma axanthum]